MGKIRICNLSMSEFFVNGKDGYYARDEKGNYVRSLQGKIAFSYGEGEEDAMKLELPLDATTINALAALCLKQASKECEKRFSAFREAAEATKNLEV